MMMKKIVMRQRRQLITLNQRSKVMLKREERKPQLLFRLQMNLIGIKRMRNRSVEFQVEYYARACSLGHKDLVVFRENQN